MNYGLDIDCVAQAQRVTKFMVGNCPVHMPPTQTRKTVSSARSSSCRVAVQVVTVIVDVLLWAIHFCISK